MPPRIGAAIGFITSDPTPVAHMIGASDRSVVPTVISFGRSRSTEPSIVASQHVPPRRAARPPDPPVERLVQVDDHDDAGLHRDAVERDVADPDRDGEVVAEPPLQQTPPVIAYTTDSMTITASDAEWNVMYSRTKMMKSTSGIRTRSRSRARTWNSYCPVQCRV